MISREKLSEIVETLGKTYSLPNGDGHRCVIRDSSNIVNYEALGKRKLQKVIEEHRVVPIKIEFLPENENIYIWFAELTTKEITKEIPTIK